MSEQLPSSNGAEPEVEARSWVVVLLLAIALTTGVAVLLIVSGGEQSLRDAVAADPECLKAWNGDQYALATGIHDYNSHLYEIAQMTRLEGVDSALGGHGVCTVVFARQTLDSESTAAGVSFVHGRWKPLSQALGIRDTQLERLQSEALPHANVRLEPDGRLSPTL